MGHPFFSQKSQLELRCYIVSQIKTFKYRNYRFLERLYKLVTRYLKFVTPMMAYGNILFDGFTMATNQPITAYSNRIKIHS